jgi:hypothetical protein
MLTKNGAAGTERYGTYTRPAVISQQCLTGRECVHHEQLSRRSVPADLSAEQTTTKRFFYNLEFARNNVMLQHSSSRRTGCLDRIIFLNQLVRTQIRCARGRWTQIRCARGRWTQIRCARGRWTQIRCARGRWTLALARGQTRRFPDARRGRDDVGQLDRA